MSINKDLSILLTLSNEIIDREKELRIYFQSIFIIDAIF
jgi:hypothetical protein